MLAVVPVRADQFQFLVQRFCTIELNTDEGAELVRIRVYPKAVPETVTILESELNHKDGVYTTPEGISFEIHKLNKPIINDKNRLVNSGGWVLLVSGEGQAYKEFLKRMPNAEHHSESLSNPIYLGKKVEGRKAE